MEYSLSDSITIVLILLLIFIVALITEGKINTTKNKQAQNSIDTNNKVQSVVANTPNSSFTKEQQNKEAATKNAVVRSAIAKKKDQ